ncbi:TrgA family protein [Tabrizicola aquatica]|uniref:TrgA family protein n=1 Tax=Tabrizicola aquatica TaxID=909926 RepID=UPI000CD2CCF2|nr:TrgA family protein [Tabrizicola aquatica]
MATQMPTGAKAMSAAAFAVVGWLIANTYVENMPTSEAVGRVREMTAVIGAICGWKVMGPSVGKGYVESAAAGLKTVVVLVFMALLTVGVYEMVQLSTKMRYEGPLEAVVDIFARMMERAPPLSSLGVLVVMLIGGVVGGILAENASRRWR